MLEVAQQVASGRGLTTRPLLVQARRPDRVLVAVMPVPVPAPMPAVAAVQQRLPPQRSRGSWTCQLQLQSS